MAAAISKKSSKLLKELRELYKLAQDTKEEMIFQQEPIYKRFKAKYDGTQCFILDMVNVLGMNAFYNECIYWCSKYLNNRGLNYQERLKTLDRLVYFYSMTNNHEKVLECGTDCLSINERKHVLIDYQKRILEPMIKSARAIGRHKDGQIYSRELLKLEVNSYNQGESDRNSLLTCYLNLIDAQMKNENFNSALKTFKHIKLFNLNSSDPNDVKNAFEQDALINEFPALYPGLKTVEDCEMEELSEILNDLCANHYPKVLPNGEKEVESVNVTDLCYKVSQLIYKKSQLLEIVYKRYGKNWFELYLFVLFNIKNHLQMIYLLTLNCVKDHNNSIPYHHKQDFFDINCELIAFTLKFVDDNPSQRGKFFLKLYLSMRACDNLEQGITNLLKNSVKKHDIPIAHFMPFIIHCLKIFGDKAPEEKQKMLLFKNSMMIIEHFDKNLSKSKKS